MHNYALDWDTLIEEYARYLRFEKNLSQNSIDAYRSDVEKLRGFAEERSIDSPVDVSADDIEQFLADIYDRGMETASQARTLSGVKSFFNFLQICEVLEESPVEFIDAPKQGRKLPDFLTLDEIDAILASIDPSLPQGHRNRAMLEILYSCGLRVSELISLKLQDLFFDEGFIRVTGKGDKQRLVPLSDVAKSYILIWIVQRRTMKPDAKNADYLFLNRNGRKLTRVMLFTIIKKAVASAGILKNVSPHTFRHSFATHLLEGGASIRQVQEMLGHESIITTEIYTHLDRSHLKKSVNAHHPLAKED